MTKLKPAHITQESSLQPAKINYGAITGPIVMIGFGSIGKGTLPLIERHFKFDRSRMVVIDPSDRDQHMPQRPAPYAPPIVALGYEPSRSEPPDN